MDKTVLRLSMSFLPGMDVSTGLPISRSVGGDCATCVRGVATGSGTQRRVTVALNLSIMGWGKMQGHGGLARFRADGRAGCPPSRAFGHNHLPEGARRWLTQPMRPMQRFIRPP